LKNSKYDVIGHHTIISLLLAKTAKKILLQLQVQQSWQYMPMIILLSFTMKIRKCQWIVVGVGLGTIVAPVSTMNVTAPSGIYWDNLSVQTADGTFLLHNCRGFVENGHVCGLLGPSGAGKSTTLSAIGGAISSVSGLEVNGDVVYFDSQQQSKEHLRIQGGKVAWLQQKDSFFNMLTVEETLQFAAFLELPRKSANERQKQVDSVMDSLGLQKLRDRKIGDSAMHKGLSGGEKRRLSLALELLSSPSLFIGDEPTSGLDSTMSAKVVRLIKTSVQERNIPCILALHQPRSSIYKMLDSVILMAPGGHVVYMGKANEAVSYFAKLGYVCPAETNPAEFLLDLVSVDSEDPRVASEDEVRISFLAAEFVEKQHTFEKWVIAVQSDEIDVDFVLENALSRDEEVAGTIAAIDRKRHTLTFRPIQRFGRLLLRSWRQNIRNHRVNIFRLITSGGTACFFTKIFQSIKRGFFTPKSVADRVALLSFSVINMR
jgi:ABC-type multidrug transport system ATPase subunit